METNTQEKQNIYQKLLVIQKKINGLSKDKKSFTYSYVTGDKVLGEIKPLMNELGLILKQEIISIENTRQDYVHSFKDGTTKDKNEILSKVLMKFTWVDCATGEKDENLFGANGQNDWEKGLGSALTYGERYFLLKYFHIATDEDDIDNDQRKKEAEKALVKAPVKKEAPTEYLNANSDKFTEAVKFLKTGGKMDSIKKKYVISEEVENQLIIESK